MNPIRALILILALLATSSHAADLRHQTLTPLAEKPVAPAMELKDIDGKHYSLKELHGKVVIVNFWATWCPPCREEMSSMERAWQKLSSEGIVMLAVNVGEDADTIFRFTADYPVTFPLLMDSDGAAAQAWPIKGLPSTFIIDLQGRIAYRAIGGREWDDPALLAPVRALRQKR